MSKVLKWLDNFWYHYKWVVIIVVFFLIVGIVLTVQLVTRQNYDAYVMYLGDASIPDTQYQDILDSLKRAAGDYNGDGKIAVNFAKTPYITDKDNEMADSINSAAVNFMSTMIVQPYYLYLINAEVYELYKDSDIFIPLLDVVEDIPSDWLYDEKAVYFDRTDFARNNAGVDNLGVDTLLVIKNIPYTSSKSTYQSEKDAFDHHVVLFRNIIEYTAEK